MPFRGHSGCQSKVNLDVNSEALLYVNSDVNLDVNSDDLSDVNSDDNCDANSDVIPDVNQMPIQMSIRMPF